MSNHHAAELRGSAGPARIAGFTLAGLSLVLLVLRPELPQLWLPPLCSLAIGAWVYRLAGQRSREVAARLYGAMQLAAWVLVIALFFGLLSELGWSPWSRNDTADRGQGLVLALIMLAYANVMPKMPASRAWQAQLRFAGWALVLGSVGYALAWLLLPLDLASWAAMAALGSALGLILIRLLWKQPWRTTDACPAHEEAQP